MIFTESTIKISNNVSKMDSTIVLYRGDKNVEIRFTILQSPFKYSNTVATNVIESTNASYGQLVIKTPNDKPPIFSEVSATKEGTILFTITKEMIDEIEEVGVYTFQIRLMDENKQSRVTIPPVENGIEIKEPIAIEDDNTTNVVGLAKANYAVATSSDVDTPTFDDNGKYNKTNWNDGDIITNVSLNKIEDGIYTTNENVTATKKYVDDNAVILPLPIHTTLESTSVAMNVVNIMDLIPGVQYSTHNNPNETRKQGYKVVYICDDGNFKTICSMPLPNRVVHLVKVLHYTNYSMLTVNNTIYKVDYSKHSILTDVQITKTLQYYLPITNTIEYNPTNDYHPATKKYVDDRFICSDLVENVGTITKEEMQKCNNGTSRYVSSINLKEFFADYKYCAYQGMYGDKSVRMIYDPQYNRVIAYDLDTIDTYDITLGFEFNSNYMYPFNGGASQVKSYQFTNDLVIVKNDILNPSEVLTKNNTHEYTPTNDYNPATKKYVDDNTPIKSLPVNSTTKTGAVVDVNNITVSGCYALPKRTDGKHWTNLMMRAMINDGSGKGKSLLLSGYQNYVFHVNVESKKIYCDNLRIVYNIGTTADTTDIRTEPYFLPTTNTKEYTPTNDYNPATKKYVDDIKPDIDGIKTDLGFCIHGEIGKNLFDKNACEIGKYINETGGTGPNADYCASDFIKVIPGETYYMTAGNSSNFQFCYYNANKEFVQYTTGGYKSFTIPQDCVYVRYTIKKADLDVIQFEKGDIATNYESYGIKLKNNVVRIENLDHNLQDILNSIPPLIVKKYDDGIIFGFKYNSNEDMRILFKPCGQSKLPQINNIYKLSNSNKYPSSDFSNLGTIFQNATSDWIGPYTVRSSNDDGDKPDSWEFTGGWHGYNGDQTGEKTASNKSFKYYIDNKEILDGEVKAGNKLKIVVVNNIQSSGTKKVDGTGREVLEETIVYTITQNSINVEVQIKALEQIKITKYYGLQTVNNSYNGQLLYNDDSMKKWTDCNNVKIDGGVKAESDCGEFKLKNNNDLLIAWVDKNYGLGKRKYVNDDKPVVWSADYNKTYMVLIDGNCDLQTDEVLYWRGGYKFISLV